MPVSNTIPKQKKWLMAIAFFCIPVALVVWTILMYTKPKPTANTQKPGFSAFNTKLPDPKLDDKQKNKLELYLQAEQDSIKRSEELKKDPNMNPSGLSLKTPGPSMFKTDYDKKYTGLKPPNNFSSIDPNEKKVNDGLQKLYALMHQTTDNSKPFDQAPNSGPYASPLVPQQTAGFQKMMELLQKHDTAPDPQIEKYNGLLDKINGIQDKLLDIQHPERLTGSSSGGSAQNSGFSVNTKPDSKEQKELFAQDEVSPVSGTGFYGLDDSSDTMAVLPGAMRAVIHADQTIQSGSVVKLRLLQDIYVRGIKIPANCFIFGPCTIENERIKIQLTNAIYDGQIYPISLKVYDAVDGLEGLYAPGAISRDVMKEGVASGVNGLGIGSFDPSIQGQALQAGIETGKTLLSRKVRAIQATVRAGHLAILKGSDASH